MDRPIAFILASSDHGTMIVNRYDYQMKNEEYGYGVGFSILNKSSFDRDCVQAGCDLLRIRREQQGDGVVAVDCGANIGVMTVEWARMMMGWGTVFAIEAQERVFQALAGNIAINNCFNAHALHAAVGAHSGVMRIPVLDPTTPSNFGGLELKACPTSEYVGQPIREHTNVSLVSLDSLGLSRVDFIKLDVEGMEVDVLRGADNIIRQFRPTLMVEYFRDEEGIRRALTQLGYRMMRLDGINFIAIHKNDDAVSILEGREVA